MISAMEEDSRGQKRKSQGTVSPHTNKSQKTGGNFQDVGVENDSSDEDIAITYSKVAPSANFPHNRADCLEHKFKPVYGPMFPPVELNKPFCKICYCYVCDIEAAKCERWESVVGAHCNATSSNVLWRKERQYSKMTLLGRLLADQRMFSLKEAADKACALVTTLKARIGAFREGRPKSELCRCQCHTLLQLNTRAHGCSACKQSHESVERIHQFLGVHKCVATSLMSVDPYLVGSSCLDSAVVLLDAITNNLLAESYSTGKTLAPSNDAEIKATVKLLAQKWKKCLDLCEKPSDVVTLAKDRLKQVFESTSWDKRYLQPLLDNGVFRVETCTNTNLQETINRTSTDKNVLVGSESRVTSKKMISCDVGNNCASLPGKIVNVTSTDHDINVTAAGQEITVVSENVATIQFKIMSQSSPKMALEYAASVCVNKSGETLWHLPGMVGGIAVCLAQGGYLEQAAIFLEIPTRIKVSLELLAKTGKAFSFVSMEGPQNGKDQCNYSLATADHLKVVLSKIFELWKRDGCHVDTTLVHLGLLKWMTDEFTCPGIGYNENKEEKQAKEIAVKEWVKTIAKHQRLDFSIPQINLDGNVLLILAIVYVSVLDSFQYSPHRVYQTLSSLNDKILYWASAALIKASCDDNKKPAVMFVSEFVRNTLRNLQWQSLPMATYDRLLEISKVKEELNVNCHILLIWFFLKEASEQWKIDRKGDAGMLKRKAFVLINSMLDKIMSDGYSDRVNKTPLIKQLKKWSCLVAEKLKKRLDEVDFYYHLSYPCFVDLRKYYNDFEWPAQSQKYNEYARMQLNKLNLTSGSTRVIHMLDLFVRNKDFSSVRKVLELHPYNSDENCKSNPFSVWSQLELLLGDERLWNRLSLELYLGAVTTWVIKVTRNKIIPWEVGQVVDNVSSFVSAIPMKLATDAFVPALNNIMKMVTDCCQCNLMTKTHRDMILHKMKQIKSMYAVFNQEDMFLSELAKMKTSLMKKKTLIRDIEACLFETVSVTVHRSQATDRPDRRLCRVEHRPPLARVSPGGGGGQSKAAGINANGASTPWSPHAVFTTSNWTEVQQSAASIPQCASGGNAMTPYNSVVTSLPPPPCVDISRNQSTPNIPAPCQAAPSTATQASSVGGSKGEPDSTPGSRNATACPGQGDNIPVVISKKRGFLTNAGYGNGIPAANQEGVSFTCTFVSQQVPTTHPLPTQDSVTLTVSLPQ